jgi:ABC-type sugar transport system substrate-binding protein
MTPRLTPRRSRCTGQSSTSQKGKSMIASNRIRTTGIAIALLVLLSTGLSACSSQGSPTPANTAALTHKSIRLGFSPLSLDIPALQNTANALTAAGANSGMVVSVADPKFNAQDQVRQLTQWITLRRVDAIWVIPVAPQSLRPVIAAARKAGIALLIDAKPQDVGFTSPQRGISFASTNFAAFGNYLGLLTSKCLNSRLNGHGKVIYLKDSTGQFGGATTDRALSRALTKGAPAANVVATISPVSQLQAEQQTASALQAHPDANAVVATNDEAALGAQSAFEQAGKVSAQTCIVGGGAGVQANAAINAGTIYAGVSFDFKTDTVDNITEIVKMVSSPAAVGASLSVPILVHAHPSKKK